MSETAESERISALIGMGVAATQDARAELGQAIEALDGADAPEAAGVATTLRSLRDALIIEEGHAPAAAAAILARGHAELEAALAVLKPLEVPDASEPLARTLTAIYALQRSLARASGMPDARPSRAPRESLAPGPADDDRRATPRVDLDVDIGFLSETNFFTGFTDDISEGGLFVATYDLLELGTRVSLSFVMPEGPHLQVEGTVVWLRDPMALDSDLHPGMGIAFDALDEASLKAIRRYMKLRAPLFFAD